MERFFSQDVLLDEALGVHAEELDVLLDEFRVNDELVLDAGVCQTASGPGGPTRVVRPAQRTLFHHQCTPLPLLGYAPRPGSWPPTWRPNYVWLPREGLLRFEGSSRLVDMFSDLGVEKLRLTGGEPLVRRDLASLVRMLAAERIRDLALTTNGLLLAEQAQGLRDAGLRRVTASLDRRGLG